MSLSELLRELVTGCDALGALIMDADGIPLAEFRSDELFDLQGCSVECLSIIRESCHATSLLESGGLEELALLTGKFRFLVTPLDDGIWLFLVQPADGIYGKARYLMRLLRHRFLKLLA